MRIDLAGGAWLDGDTLIYAGEPICERHELLLCGLHNVSNFLAAATICGAIGDAISSGTTRSDITSNDATIDVTSESMKLVAQRFPGCHIGSKRLLRKMVLFGSTITLLHHQNGR